MLFNIGDVVTRNSYNNDVCFKIVDIDYFKKNARVKDMKVTDIDNDIAILEGINYRLSADSKLTDLKKENIVNNDDNDLLNRFGDSKLNRDEYFYLPGKILHIDADKDYLKRCMKFYEKINIKAKGIRLKEGEIKNNISSLLDEYKPDILVITGHDAYYRKMGSEEDNNNYKNTINFIDAVRVARKNYNHENLIIIAGACQSNYEELIKAGANFASSPKRINIHALDPAIIASSLALSDRNRPIDLLNILDKTKYGKDGIGGIITNGTMYVGYPR